MTSPTRKDLFPGALEMMILRAAAASRCTATALVQHIQRPSNDLLQIEEGSLYPALQRLLKAGCVSARWERLQRTARRVRSYQLIAAVSSASSRRSHGFEQMLEGIRLVLAPVKP